MENEKDILVRDESLKISTVPKLDTQSASQFASDFKRSIGQSIQDALQEVSSKTSYFAQRSRMRLESIKDNLWSNSDSSFESDEESELADINLEMCTTQSYIEHTVGQILLTALTILERERPDNPIKWLAEYLLFHKDDPPELKGQPFQLQTPEIIKLPEHVKKVILEDSKDIEIEASNELI